MILLFQKRKSFIKQIKQYEQSIQSELLICLKFQQRIQNLSAFLHIQKIMKRTNYANDYLTMNKIPLFECNK
ncbi:unnamed protein product [Paramecium octaurelia]|uniref:Uncharacterized protein n=1 Tax=Paramecium octaurelia TaxID=43137 RepID=A0A8S1TZN1_PAROT|nr:unnamed protein product [Paramecium octaurelia]